MSATIHFDEKYKAALMEGFDKASETDGLFDHSLDMEFSGVKTVHVKSLRTEPLQDYDRTKGVGTGSRYGDTKEVGNEEQTFTMTQDKSLSLSVDKGNNMDASILSRTITNKLFEGFRHDSSAKNSLQAVDVELPDGKTCVFTGMLVKADSDIHSLVGVFADKELSGLYRTNFECAASVFSGQLKGVC